MEYLVDLLIRSVGQLIGFLTNSANYCAGTLTGFLLGLLAAYVNRLWRREDVRSAEKRVRWEERLEPVWRYTTGLQEFVHEAGHLMEHWEQRRPVEAWESLAEELQGQLEMLWEDVEVLKPRPGALYVVQDEEARKWYVALLLDAAVCRHKCRECLGVGAVMTEEDASGFAADADEALKKLLEQMRKFVENVEG